MASAQPSHNSQQAGQQKQWRQTIKSLYPHILNKTYCVPPLIFNRVPYCRKTLTEEPVFVQHSPSSGPPDHDIPSVVQGKTSSGALARYSLWTQEPRPEAKPKNVQDSDIKDDFAQRHVLSDLKRLGDDQQEVMFILSQLEFLYYLDQPVFATAHLPKPKDIGMKDGEFDILIFHRLYGILIVELKSVGLKFAPSDAVLVKRVAAAVKQLDRLETVVRYCLNDLAPGVMVRKALFLPYISRVRLQQVLAANPQLEQDVCQTLGVAPGADAVQLCVCSDEMSDPTAYWEETPAAFSRLKIWWQKKMSYSVDITMTDDLYCDIVARFVGPATTASVHCVVAPRAGKSGKDFVVDVHTEADAVAELGVRLARLVLTTDQLTLVLNPQPLVCITGPPGVGKTIVLVLIALEWMSHGNDVYIFNSVVTNFACSALVMFQVTGTVTANPGAFPGQIKFKHADFSIEATVDASVKELAQHAQNQSLHIIMDDASFCDQTVGPRTIRFVTDLAAQVPGLHLWAATVGNDRVPPILQHKTLTVPLRCAPRLVREVEKVVEAWPTIDNYTDNGIPAPGDGLDIIQLQHEHGNQHTGDWPIDCEKCGQDVAEVLRQLHIGSASGTTSKSATPLTYRDVFVLTRMTSLTDDLTDAAGNVTKQASGIVRGLRSRGFPVKAVGDKIRAVSTLLKSMTDIAIAMSDEVTVTLWGAVTGLERKVVVWVKGRDSVHDDGQADVVVDAHDRLNIVTRCTTQLIVVNTAPQNNP